MPIITINDPRSLAHNKLSFWFDTAKPRSASKCAKRKALKRQNKFRKEIGLKELSYKDIHSFDHINKNRAQGDSRNLFAYRSQDQHKNIELQPIELFTTLFNMGKIGFDYVTKKYFIACNQLETDIKTWLNQGTPNLWQIFEHKNYGK